MSELILEPAKKFYKTAAHGPAPKGEGFVVLLDGRTLRTPAKAVLSVPSEPLAALIAGEWHAQDEHILPATMPITRLTNVALDRMPLARNETVAEIVRYAGSDLLLARADEPEGLIAAEKAAWDPILDWTAEALGARFTPAAGFFLPDQDPAALEAVAARARVLDDFRLTAMAHLGALYGSSLLALAVLAGRLAPLEAFHAARVDEAWQEAKWGVDYEAAERTARLKGEVEAVERYLKAL
jgi:chaperone required for assembly of F1-ATPase